MKRVYLPVIILVVFSITLINCNNQTDESEVSRTDNVSSQYDSLLFEDADLDTVFDSNVGSLKLMPNVDSVFLISTVKYDANEADQKNYKYRYYVHLYYKEGSKKRTIYKQRLSISDEKVTTSLHSAIKVPQGLDTVYVRLFRDRRGWSNKSIDLVEVKRDKLLDRETVTVKGEDSGTTSTIIIIQD